MSKSQNPGTRQDGSNRRHGTNERSGARRTVLDASRVPSPNSSREDSARRSERGRSDSMGNTRTVKRGSTGTIKRDGTGNVRTTQTPRADVGKKPHRPSADPAKSKGRNQARRGKHVAKHAAPPKKKGFPLAGCLIILVLLAGLGVGGYFAVTRIFFPYEGALVEDGLNVTVVIPEGSSGSDIIKILLDSGVIHSTRDFRKAVNEQNADMSLRCGTYTFVTGSDPNEIVAQLVSGPNSTENQLKVPEGLTLTKTAALVEDSLGINHEEFVQQAQAANYANKYAFLTAAGKGTLEGYLYPKTYDFAGKEVTADSVIRMMLDQFGSEVNSLDMSGAEKVLAEKYNLNVTDYDILKIASIIEKEALNEDDRTKISSVFYNRLKIGMALESDATMGYVTGGAVTSQDLTVDSPYNTYLHKGLPPTPICSPSLWAIQAAMQPADTDYLFFFIIEDGVYSNHTFSKTYEEHNSAYTVALAEQKSANEQSKKGQ